jgi:Putative restriction endonuclease
MPAGALIPVEHYLRSVYRPDCDYVDSLLEERNAGERDHSLVQANLVAYFHSRRRETGVVALPEWRFRLIGNPFRVPDVIVTRGKPEEPDPEYGAAALHRDFVPERWDFSF